MKGLKKMYAESFMRRILRLVEIFTSVASISEYPLAMVQRVANPYMLYTLMNLLLVASPRSKFIAIKIIQNLVKIGIPTEVFETTVGMLSKNKGSLGHKILQTDSQIKFEGSSFITFFFNYLLTIRKAMWDRNDVQSEGSYEVS